MQETSDFMRSMLLSPGDCDDFPRSVDEDGQSRDSALSPLEKEAHLSFE